MFSRNDSGAENVAHPPKRTNWDKEQEIVSKCIELGHDFLIAISNFVHRVNPWQMLTPSDRFLNDSVFFGRPIFRFQKENHDKALERIISIESVCKKNLPQLEPLVPIQIENKEKKFGNPYMIGLWP
jgi:hypothetical protein